MMLIFVCLTGHFFFNFLSAMTISLNIRGNLIAPCNEPSRFVQGFIVQPNFVRASRKRGEHPMATVWWRVNLVI